MQWIIHGTIVPAVREALLAREDKVHELPELELAASADAREVLKAAHVKQWDVITDDSALAQAALKAGVAFGRSIVLLLVGPGEVEQDDAIDRLFNRYGRLAPRRLYTVTNSRVKVRQLPE